MNYNEELTVRVRTALAHIAGVEEKKMFGGICFMVNRKMCITVGHERLMCRIDPTVHKKILKRKGCRTVVMKGREYKGYVHVDKEGITKDFDFWIRLALEFNKKAKASPKSRKKK